MYRYDPQPLTTQLTGIDVDEWSASAEESEAHAVVMHLVSKIQRQKEHALRLRMAPYDPHQTRAWAFARVQDILRALDHQPGRAEVAFAGIKKPYVFDQGRGRRNRGVNSGVGHMRPSHQSSGGLRGSGTKLSSIRPGMGSGIMSQTYIDLSFAGDVYDSSPAWDRNFGELELLHSDHEEPYEVLDGVQMTQNWPANTMPSRQTTVIASVESSRPVAPTVCFFCEDLDLVCHQHVLADSSSTSASGLDSAGFPEGIKEEPGF